jgi:hypothetical protein
MTKYIAIVLVLCPILLTAQAETPKPKIIATHTFTKDGTAAVQCVCVVASSGCKSALYDALNESQRHTWGIDVFGKFGEVTDVRLSCYRKRDVDKLGNGLCCSVSEESGKPGMKELVSFFGALSVHEK